MPETDFLQDIPDIHTSSTVTSQVKRAGSGRRDIPVPEGERESLPVGSFMRLARQEKGIKITDFARDIGYSTGHLSGVEIGKHMPSRELMQAYESALGIETGQLLNRRGLNAVELGSRYSKLVEHLLVDREMFTMTIQGLEKKIDLICQHLGIKTDQLSEKTPFDAPHAE